MVQVLPSVQVCPLTVVAGFTSSALGMLLLGKVCVAVQVFGWVRFSVARTAPVVGEMLSVPSLLATDETAPPPPEPPRLTTNGPEVTPFTVTV